MEKLSETLKCELVNESWVHLVDKYLHTLATPHFVIDRYI